MKTSQVGMDMLELHPLCEAAMNIIVLIFKNRLLFFYSLWKSSEVLNFI